MLLKHSPTVEFDPANKDHRASVISFMKRNAWSDSNHRFTHDVQFSSVADQVKARMLEWYTKQEFKDSK